MKKIFTAMIAIATITSLAIYARTNEDVNDSDEKFAKSEISNDSRRRRLRPNLLPV